MLPNRVELDHFPKPASVGGKQVVESCVQCHDLKDRTSWEDLPSEMKAQFMEDFMRMSRAGRIVFAQFMRMAYEAALIQKRREADR